MQPASVGNWGSAEEAYVHQWTSYGWDSEKITCYDVDRVSICIL